MFEPAPQSSEPPLRRARERRSAVAPWLGIIAALGLVACDRDAPSGSVPGNAPEPAPGLDMAPPAAHSETLEDAELRAFVAASNALNSLQQQIQQNLMQSGQQPSEADMLRAQQTMDEGARDILSNHGLDMQRYQQIQMRIQQDPQLAERASVIAREEAPSGTGGSAAPPPAAPGPGGPGGGPPGAR